MGIDEDDAKGEGASERSEARMRDGWGNLIWIPWTPIVQSRYEDASSKSVSNETLDHTLDASDSNESEQHVHTFKGI